MVCWAALRTCTPNSGMFSTSILRLLPHPELASAAVLLLKGTCVAGPFWQWQLIERDVCCVLQSTNHRTFRCRKALADRGTQLARHVTNISQVHGATCIEDIHIISVSIAQTAKRYLFTSITSHLTITVTLSSTCAR